MTQEKYKLIALIPARSGSKRIKSKNIKLLRDHPLIAYTITISKKSGLFSKVVVSTDSEDIGNIAEYYGAEVPFLRPLKYSMDHSPDIEWVKYTLERLSQQNCVYDVYFILRPTSPFRKIETLINAWKKFIENPKVHSLRAIEKCKQHPYKMWKIEDKIMKPIFSNPDNNSTPWHSMQYHTLPEVYVQNASLEIAWSVLPLKYNTISGHKIVPFITQDYEGYDINDEIDWTVAENLIRLKKVNLPKISKKPYNLK